MGTQAPGLGEAMVEEQKLKGNDEILSVLRKLPIFQIFTEEDLLRMHVHDVVRIKKYREGEIIIEQGNYEKTFYVLLSGEIKVQKGKKRLAVCSEQGAIFGEMSFILGKGRTATVLADKETVCLEIDMAYIDFFEGAEREEYLTKFYRFLAPLVTQRLGSANAVKVDVLARIREKEEEIDDFVRARRAEIEELKKELEILGADSDEDGVLRQILARGF